MNQNTPGSLRAVWQTGHFDASSFYAYALNNSAHQLL
jgi:hypothetical protein